MNIGRKPAGATYTAKRRVETWGEAEMIAYIDERTRAAGKNGIEYDEIERQILSDPWVEDGIVYIEVNDITYALSAQTSVKQKDVEINDKDLFENIVIFLFLFTVLFLIIVVFYFIFTKKKEKS